MTAIPMLGGAVATAALLGAGPYSYLVGGLFGLSAVAMLVSSWAATPTAPRKAELRRLRRDYFQHLAEVRARVRASISAQQNAHHRRHPAASQLWSIVSSYRLWERRRADSDFGVVRVAVGPQPLATPLLAPASGPPERREPATAEALRHFLTTYAVVPDLPVTVPLLAHTWVHLHCAAGPEAAAGVTRSIVTQLATFHAPDDLVIAVCTGAEQRRGWEWVKWLPHANHRSRRDAAGPVRLVATSVRQVAELLHDLAGPPPFADGPHVVVIQDGPEGDGWSELPTNVTVLSVGAPPPPHLATSTVELAVGVDDVVVRTGNDEVRAGAPDQLSPVEAETLARHLAPYRLPGEAGEADSNLEPDLVELLRLGDPYRFEPPRAPRPTPDHLRVPIGVDGAGTPVCLDLKESAEGGMGPHGLLVGATGSGKSELLRTLVLGLAATHSSAELNLVLIDFKGGATFASLDRLPHTAAVITNLADELPLVDRMTDALNGELVRRQELLRRAGNFAHRRDYELARTGGAPLTPLPALLIICDEFSELLVAEPDFIELFLQIGRLGRSLGVHLLLASQRLEEGRLRGLDTHLSYRIGLRTFSTLESRAVLGVPDAYELPRSPGHGYLKSGTDPLVRFQAAYTSGAWRRPPAELAGRRPPILPFSTHPVPTPAAPAPVLTARPPNLLDLVVSRLVGQGPPAHPVWLPPLAEPPTLDELVGEVAPVTGRGLTTTDRRLHGGLRVPVGLVDQPYQQLREPLWLALAGATGHVAVVGGPHSGKSQLLQTLVTALALTHTPSETHVYCLDFGGGSLASLRALPHVGAVAGRLEPDLVRRTIREVAGVLREREHGPWPDHRTAHIFLVIDGWATLRNEFGDLESVVTDLATRGLSYGVHVVATAARWLDLRHTVRDLFGTRLELRLGDPADSLAARRAAEGVPPDQPGRGITATGQQLLTALPRLAGTDLPTLVQTVAAAWSGAPAPAVRLLPTEVAYDPPAPVAGGRAAALRLPVGLAEADLREVTVDFSTEPHLLIFGDAECGKSAFLRALTTSITHRFRPEQARLILIDYRRSLLGAVTTDHVIGYGGTPEEATELIASTTEYLRRRLPGPQVTAEQLRRRSWWTGPECFILVDDYDLVGAGTANPLLPLLEVLTQARDIGLHLVLARRCGGAARAMYEPVAQRLRELSTPGLVMSGNPDEGPLIGSARPAPLPPGRGWLVTRKEGVRLVQLSHLRDEINFSGPGYQT